MTEFPSKFNDYLKTIGMSNTLRDKVETIFNFYTEICKMEIKDLFVTDFFTSDGVRQYQNLWFFSDNSLMEAHDFVTTDKFDASPVSCNITRWELTKSDYDFYVTTDKSKLKIYIRFNVDTYGELNAAKENCAYLLKIFEKYILSNFGTSG